MNDFYDAIYDYNHQKNMLILQNFRVMLNYNQDL